MDVKSLGEEKQMRRLCQTKVKSYLIRRGTSVTFGALGEGLLTVVLKRPQGRGNDGSTGLKAYWSKGFGTEDVLPSGVVILTVCIEMTSGGGTLFPARIALMPCDAIRCDDATPNLVGWHRFKPVICTNFVVGRR